MVDKTQLKAVLKANDLNPTSPKEAVLELLRSLRWRNEEVDESVFFLQHEGWFIAESPLAPSKKKSISPLFFLREQAKYLLEKIQKKHVYIDEPLARPPVFNTMQHQVSALEELKPQKPFLGKPIIKYLVRRIIRDLFIITALSALIVLFVTYRFSLYAYIDEILIKLYLK